MANLEVIALDTATPQLRAPGGSDGYVMNSELTVAVGNVADGSASCHLTATIPNGSPGTFAWTGYKLTLNNDYGVYKQDVFPIAVYAPDYVNPPFTTKRPFSVDSQGYCYAIGIYDSGYGNFPYKYSLDSFGMTLYPFYMFDADGFYLALADFDTSAYTKGLQTKLVRTMPGTVAQLPAVGTALPGARGFVTDATLTMTLGVGTIVAGGGANSVPVYCDGTNWLIG